MIFQKITSLTKKPLTILLIGLLCFSAPVRADQVASGQANAWLTPEMKKYGYWFLATWSFPRTAMVSILREFDPIQTAKTTFGASEDLSPELQETINTILTKFGIDPKTIRVLNSTSPYVQPALAIGSNVMLINQSMVANYSLEELEFLVGHELAHLQAKDNAEGIVVALAAPFIAHYGLRAWDAGVNKATTYLKERVAPHSFADTTLTNINTTNNWVSTCGVTTCFVAWKLYNAWSRQVERDADWFAIKHLKSSKGACDFFSRIQEQQKPMRELSWKHRIVIDKNGDNLGDNLHPLLSERIAYCKEWEGLL
ncbi:MAG: M48 family metalloprotease [Candidatus Babeliales bacterium]